MSNIDFPSNPSNNQIYTFGNRSWLYNNTAGGFWTATSVTTGYAGSLGFTGSQGNIGYSGSRGAYDAVGFTGSQGNL